MMAKIEARLRQHGNDHWVAVLEEAGVPCGPVNYRAHLHTDPQARELNLIWELENRDLGNYRVTGHPIRFLKTPAVPRKAAPAMGEHNEALLREHGYSDEEIARLRETRVIR